MLNHSTTTQSLMIKHNNREYNTPITTPHVESKPTQTRVGEKQAQPENSGFFVSRTENSHNRHKFRFNAYIIFVYYIIHIK